MSELVYETDLKSVGESLMGSSPIVPTKVCCISLIDKSIEEFSFKNKNKGTFQSQCKECKKVYHNNYYRNNKHVYAKAKAKQIAKGYNSDKQLRDFCNSFKANGCILCNEKHYAALDFHHINPLEKDRTIARATSRKEIEKEVKKCVVLCSNCHRKYHANDDLTVKLYNEYIKNLVAPTKAKPD